MRRREFLGAAGATALVAGTPIARGQAAAVFRHGVASFDPTATSVILWTFAPSARGAVRWSVARDSELADVVAAGETANDDSRPIVVTVDDLEPQTTYWYAFDAGGTRSPIGRTRTLPTSDDASVRIGVVSCARFGAGYFTAYRALAARDVDFVLHLGDYIYEDDGSDNDVRRVDPPRECRTADDYRARYAQARLDPDLRRLHQLHPMIAIRDDHEVSDDSYTTGASGHDDTTDGPWAARLRAASGVHREWLPSRAGSPGGPDATWRAIELGAVGRLLLLDTRYSGRDEKVGASTVSGLHDAQRSMLGDAQRAWLVDQLADAAPPWIIVANSVMFNALRIPTALLDDPASIGLVVDGDAAINADQWDGYPAERDRVVEAASSRGAGVLVLTGDIHSSWAFEGPVRDGSPALVEAVVPSITSGSLGDRLPGSAPLLAAGAQALDPTLLYAELSQHGFVIADIERERAQVEWWFVADPRQRGAPRTATRAAAFTVAATGPPRLETTTSELADPRPTTTSSSTSTTTSSGAPAEPVPADDGGGDGGLAVAGGIAAATVAGVAGAIALRRRRAGAP